MSLGLCFCPIKYDQKWVSYLGIECYHYCGQSSKWFSEFGENDLDRSLQLRNALLNGTVFLVVPELLFYELANALRYNPRFSPKDVEGAVDSVLDMGLDVRTMEKETLREAIRLAFKCNSTVYDTYFLALSITEGKPLITADYKFTEKLKGVKGIIKLSDT